MSVRRLAICYLLSLNFYHPASAQIVINNPVFPVVGDTLHYIFGNQAGAINQIFTPPGGPQAWDLSGLQPSQSWNQIMKNPATGSASGSFPGASIVFNPLSSNDQVYLQVTGSQVLDMGYYGLDPIGLGLTLLFDRIPDLEQSWAPMDFFAFMPHQSSSNVLTAFDAPIAPPILLNLVPTADSFRIRITQQRISSIDAFGTLAIPGGTFDVLRKKQTEYRSTAVDVKVAPLGWIDISTIGGQPLLPLGTDTITTFHFLNDVSKEAIAICTLNTAQNTVTNVQYKMTSIPPPNAGPDQTLCETTPAQLNATYMAGTPSWSVVSGPSTSSSQFSNTSDPQAIFTPAGGPGAYTLRFTVTDGMNSASDDVIITFNQASTIDAGIDQTVCPNDTIKLYAVLSGAATSMVWQLNAAYGSYVGPNTDPNAKFLLNANGKAQPFIRFGAMSNDPTGPCPGGVDTVTIFINSAGPDQTLCISDGSAQLGAGGSGSWNVVSGPSTASSQFSSTTNPNATFTPTGGFGTYTLRWTTVNCSDDVVITFNQASIIDAGPDQTICPNDTIFLQATLSGVAISMVWEKNVAFGTFVDSDTDPNAKFVLNANGKAQPFIRFGAMSNDPGAPCFGGGVDTVTIFINSAGPDQTLCISDGSAQLGAGGSGSWNVVSGPSTASSQFSSTTDPNAVFTPAGGFGAYTLRWTTANCSDDVLITFNQASIIDAGPDQTVCPNDTIFLHATLSGVATSMVWEKNVAFGTFVGPDTDPNAKFVLNSNGQAQPFIRFGAMSNDPGGPCSGGGVDTVTIFINSAGSDQTLCDEHAQLGAGGSGTWSVFSGPSTANSQFSSTNAPNAVFTPEGGLGTYTLRWTTSNCSDDVLTTFIEAAIIDAGPDQTVCPNDTIKLHATLSGTATSMVWQLNAAYGNFVGPDTDPNAKFLLNATGKAQPFISFGAMTNDPAGPCPIGVDTVKIFIGEPIAPTCPPHLMVCYDQPAFTLTGGMPAGGFFSGPGVSNNMFNPGAAGLGDHVITFSALDINGCLAHCTFVITVDNGVPINIISNNTYCAGEPGPVIGVDPSFVGFQYQLKDADGANLGAPVAGTGSAIYFGAYPNGFYRVVATSAQCTGNTTATTQATPTNCRIDIPDFCDCNSPTGFTPVTIKISAPPGMNWTVKDRIGLYEQQQPNLPMPIGTSMTYIGNNMYQLFGARANNGYWVRMTNGFTDFDIMVGNPSW
ncbi:MAG: hypothetical protein H6574_06915 [Lewinellaceae bacterium]|nr:hypothetical protein [Saprospiraceae bacterium]MCB9330795.1 hypothetical protein [Lewinellaceae bacterium]